MYNIAKSIINKGLSYLGYEIRNIKPGVVNGWNLETDIKTIVATDRPVCFDVGANEGQTIDLFRKCFNNPIVHSFEPSKDVFEKLKSRFNTPDLHLHNIALGDKKESKVFINYESSVHSSFLKLDKCQENRFKDIPEKNRENVDVSTVDYFINTHEIHTLDLLKIDTQGYDIKVLKGAKESFSRGVIRSVFIEINFINMYEGQSLYYEIINYLNDHGLHLIDLYEKSRVNNRIGWCTALFSK